MAGISKLYVVGGQGGFMGSDGVNPVDFIILVGDSSRQWLEPVYHDPSIKPLGRLTTIIPEGPDRPDSLLDACIAFAPGFFSKCPSLKKVRVQLADTERLDFDLGRSAIPTSWAALREEARPIYQHICMWQATLVPMFEPQRN